MGDYFEEWKERTEKSRRFNFQQQSIDAAREELEREAREPPVSLLGGLAFIVFLFGLQSLQYVVPWLGEQWRAFLAVFGL